MMSNRIDRYCKSCGNVTVADAGYYAGSSFYQCETCGRRGMSDIFPKATVFHQITASPAVLAEKLVYSFRIIGGCQVMYSSSIIDNCYKQKKRAIAATLEKLEEVCVEQNAGNDTQADLCKADNTKSEVEDEL